MEEQQSSVAIAALQMQRRKFAHELAAKIESMGINDEQRRLIMLDMARCFEDHALALRTWELLVTEFGDAATLGAD